MDIRCALIMSKGTRAGRRTIRPMTDHAQQPRSINSFYIRAASNRAGRYLRVWRIMWEGTNAEWDLRGWQEHEKNEAHPSSNYERQWALSFDCTAQNLHELDPSIRNQRPWIFEFTRSNISSKSPGSEAQKATVLGIREHTIMAAY